MAFDEDRWYVEIEPAVAVSDVAEPVVAPDPRRR